MEKLNFPEITRLFEVQMKLEFEIELLETNFLPYSFGSGFSAFKIRGITITILYDGRDDLIQINKSKNHEKYPNCTWSEIYSGKTDDFLKIGIAILKNEIKKKN